MSDIDSSPSVCIINSTLPNYQPNVFVCSPGSSCCTHRGLIACCQNDVTFLQLLKQSLPFAIIFVVIFGMACFIHLFFEDDETGKPINQKNTFHATELILPTKDDFTVEDPVFGKLYEHRVPKLASIPPKTIRSLTE